MCFKRFLDISFATQIREAKNDRDKKPLNIIIIIIIIIIILNFEYFNLQWKANLIPDT